MVYDIQLADAKVNKNQREELKQYYYHEEFLL